ncbi:multiubiquitin domain-containing protein [Paraburkholderia sp. SEWSISQ10-3 4]|uniref:multiubiquitin domain-containing protein n=1 Tax=Paraburkholderia TaxID=1822464 RepID=UPI00225AE244|nr:MULTISPECIES: multiubiquitin domain-containing protein [Paraburkholderia]MCX4141121.1 multiubiquitin domain-containing protein [Paraburkholderia aspalathi]MDN7173804.1 multiubiquitin domain-containing protein [Paraburkholderia sp. SEWSISQ10-3 4]MDQ6503445.1 multiubiquitin domain-containing protein [Paraburkholderia aspalathi]
MTENFHGELPGNPVTLAAVQLHGLVEEGFIQVSGLDFVFRRVNAGDKTPTGAQIAAAAGFKPSEGAAVLLLLSNGELEDVRPDEVVDLRRDGRQFIVVVSDRLYFLTIDGVRYEWPSPVISGAQVRKLGGIAPEKTVHFERADGPDRELGNTELVDLGAAGIEAFVGRLATWILNVQGVRLDLHVPEITVRDAMEKAGFDIKQAWHIYLKVVGQPKEEVQLDTVIDLRRPGIEKLRLTPRDVSNGDSSINPRFDFALLESDEEFLNRHYASWETRLDDQRRWLLIHNFAVPSGYTTQRITLALEVPSNYPQAQIDMFYAHPAIALVSRQVIAATEATVQIDGKTYQRWSRHRGGAAPWRPETDNVVTHLALVESALAKEVAQ